MLHVTAAERKVPPARRLHPDGTMRATPGRRSIGAMAGKRSPEFIAVPMVAIAAVYAAVLLRAFTADTGLAWTIFVLANAAVIVLAFVLRRTAARAAVPAGRGGDGAKLGGRRLPATRARRRRGRRAETPRGDRPLSCGPAGRGVRGRAGALLAP